MFFQLKMDPHFAHLSLSRSILFLVELFGGLVTLSVFFMGLKGVSRNNAEYASDRRMQQWLGNYAHSNTKTFGTRYFIPQPQLHVTNTLVWKKTVALQIH